MKRVIVIGGGITGCAAAYELTRRGAAVRLFERHRLAAMASGWTLGGVRQSGRHPAELPMARAAAAVWPDLAERLGRETGYVRKGNIRLARNLEEVPVIRLLVEEQRALGLDLTFLDGMDEVRRVAPAIGASVLAGSFCPSDGFADPVAATAAFARAAERNGAEIAEGSAVSEVIVRKGRIEGVETSGGFMAADAVIVAAGTHAPGLLAPLGLELPLEITQVQVIETEPAPACFDQVFGVASADCAGRQAPDGRFRYTTGLRRFAGDGEMWTETALAPSAADMEMLRLRVSEVLPVAARTPIARSWGGLIDLTPDHLPVIDAPAAVRGLVVAAGFSGHGFAIGPVTGRLAAELALGEQPFLDLSAFRVDRFPADERSAMTPTLHG